VRDRDHTLARHERAQTRLNGSLDLAVERRGGFVEHQDRCVFEDHTSDGDSLALPARQLHAALADLRRVAAPLLPVLELADELVGVGELRRSNDLGVACLWAAVTDVVADRAVQQRGILGDDGDLRAQALLRDRGDILAVDQNAAAFEVEKD